MAENYFKFVNMGDLYPAFRQRVEALQAACLARGAAYYVVSAYRSVDAQNVLYAQGRTAPGVIVTNARGGSSYHNYRIAVDFCMDKDMARAGLQPDYRSSEYAILGEEAAKLGLEWGGSWIRIKDYPHVQLKISSVGLGIRDLQAAYARGGEAGVTALLDAHRW